MTDPIAYLLSLVQLPSAAIVWVAVLVFGYMLKLAPSFDNQRIPLLVFPCSSVIYLGLCVPPSGAADSLLSTIRYLITTLVLGAGIGGICWATHAWGLKAIETRIPFLGPALKNLQVAENETTKTETSNEK